MDQYLLEHANRYTSLVRGFKPDQKQKVVTDAGNPDVVVAVRLRPLLPDEVNNGINQGVFIRPNINGLFDVHELKRPIRGPPALPTLRVCCSHTTIARSRGFTIASE